MSDVIFKPLFEFEEFKRIINSIEKGHTPISILGLTEIQKSHILAAIDNKVNNTIFVISYNDIEAQKMYNDLYSFLGEKVSYFPSVEINYYHMAARSNEIVAKRINVIKDLIQRKVKIVVGSVYAFQILMIHSDIYKKYIRRFQVGQTVNMDELVQWLVMSGYERVETVEGMGQFSIRGGIVDIYPLTSETGYRFEFFDNEIDSIRKFEPLSQRSTDKIKECSIYPAVEMPLSHDIMINSAKKIQESLNIMMKRLKSKEMYDESEKLKQNIENDISNFRSGVYFNGYETYISYFYNDYCTLMDYAEDPLVFIDEPARIKESFVNFKNRQDEDFKDLLQRGEVLPNQLKLYFQYDEFIQMILRCKMAVFQMFPKQFQNFSPKNIYQFITRSMELFHGQFDMFAEEIKRWKSRKYKILIVASSKNKGLKIAQTLEEHGIIARYEDDKDADLYEGTVLITQGYLTSGFEYPDFRFAVISEEEIFGLQKKKIKPVKKKSGYKLDVFTDLKVGDYVVHETYGIGVYTGINKMVVEGNTRDYINIKYASGDKLYVPTDQMDLVQKYIGGSENRSPRLSKLGGTDWNKTKVKVSESLKKMAEDLTKLYAARSAAKGFAFSKDTAWQKQFEDNFQYDETPDQLQCIIEIKKDMESPKVMDRLLCGDVGYGKTEVAIRAAFKAVMDGKQVALLVPTTILAQQHYNTFVERFNGFPVTIDVLSRFKTYSEQKKTVHSIKDGNVDIIIGTHRLLGKDIKFKNLGLLVIDEEQRFGVAHKEAIKKLKENVDVLVMTATPIPRTLHMSLVGIRDMSIIENPPEERYPVQTYVVEFNEGVIRDAILREMQRGGQVYFVYNRVETIDRFSKYLSEFIPEARIAVGHGQMSETALEEIMVDFYNKEYDILLCTTIIEIGLDMPNVNTIIIFDADKFGLSQLYQLRGRVGRSNRTAFAYLTFRKDKVLSEVAEKRLHAIKEFTEFGSGFKIAMRDLEIRGAGNVLGPQQHGHMAAVGYDMYCKLLADEVRKLKGEEVKPEIETSFDLRIDAYIPETYIKNEAQKIEIYKKIAAIQNIDDKNDVEDEIEDRFGTIPESVYNLIDISYLKIFTRKLSIISVNQENDKVIVKFQNGADISLQALVEVLEKYKKSASLSASNPPYIVWKDKSIGTNKMITEMREFVSEIYDLQQQYKIV